VQETSAQTYVAEMHHREVTCTVTSHGDGHGATWWQYIYTTEAA
jgi:hypothetical protein